MYGFANMAAGERRNLLHIARQALSMPRFSPLALMNDNRAVAGVNVGHLWSEAQLLREEIDALLDAYRQGAIRPVVDSTFPFAKAADAHRRMQGRQNVGKILLVP
jgi:synaptic vesicle membrane protein VAT-1